MPRRLAVMSLGIFLMGFLAPGLAGPRDAQWKKVTEAIEQGLPQTAIKELDPIVSQAEKDQAYAEAIKAISMKIALQGDVQGDKSKDKISRMQTEIGKAPKAMQPVMQAILAHWYWEFFQEQNWDFLQRTPIAAPSNDDIQTWDLPRVLAEIDKHFRAALAGEAELKRSHRPVQRPAGRGHHARHLPANSV